MVVSSCTTVYIVGVMPETIAIIAVGVGLGGLMLTLFQLTNRRVDSLERKIDSLQQQQSSLGERQSRVEGIMEAIRDLLIRTPAPP